MSHELKTPLANIREGTELLLDGSVGELDSPQREVTGILRINGLKLQQLIENLLSFSAWQAKSEVLTLTDFELRKQVIFVAKAQRLALQAANIQLKLEVDDIIVNADQDKIRTVLIICCRMRSSSRLAVVTSRSRRAGRKPVSSSSSVIPGRESRTRRVRGYSRRSSRAGGNRVDRSAVRESGCRLYLSVFRHMTAP